jgi:hypothetical protein
MFHKSDYSWKRYAVTFASNGVYLILLPHVTEFEFLSGYVSIFHELILFHCIQYLFYEKVSVYQLGNSM